MSRARVTRRLTALTAATALLSAAGLVSGVFVGVASAQTVTSLTPSAASNNAGGVTKFTVAGSGFTATLDSVSVVPKTPGDEVAALSGTVDTQNSTATALIFTVDLRLAAPVQYDVVVTQMSVPSSTVATCSSCLTVTNPGRATITGVASDGDAGSIVVNGTNFARGAKLTWLTSDGATPPTYTVDPAMTFTAGHTSGSTHTTGYPAATQIKGVYTAGAAAVSGLHYLKVTNLDGQGSSQLVEFYQPKFTSVSPTTIGQGAMNKSITVTGTGIRSGSRFVISPFSSTKADVTVGTATVTGDTTITAPVSVAGTTATNAGGPSARTTTIIGPDGGYASGSGLSVTAPPVPASTDVTALGQGAVDAPVTVTGTGFVAGTTFAISGGGISVKTVSVPSATSAKVTVSVAPNAVVGDRDEITATNPDGGVGILGVQSGATPLSSDTYPFTVDAGPVISNVSSSPALTPGSTATVTVSGTGFSTSGVTLKASGGVTFGAATVVNAMTATATATVPANTAQGTLDITITNTGDKGQYTCTGCIGVDGLTVSPKTGPNTNSDFDLTLAPTSGNDFTGAMGTVLHKTGGPAFQPDLTGASKGSNVYNFDLTSAATGKYDAIVNKPSGTVSCTGCFTVSGEVFTVTSPTTAAPAKGGQGAVDFPLTLTGTKFSRGMKVTIPGATVSDATFASPTSITVKVTIPSDLATGNKNIVVSNADGGNAVTVTNGYTVVAAPTITSATTSASTTNNTSKNIGQGAVGFGVQIVGTGFTAGQATFSGTGITSTATTTDATHLAVSATVASDAPIGGRDITVTNTDNGGTTSVPLKDGVIVTAAPVVTVVSPAKLAQGQSVTMTITGQSFQAGAAPVIANVSFADTTVSSDGGTLTTTATVSSSAPEGTRNATVNNIDGGRGVCSGCFTVTAPKTPPTFTLGTNTIAAGQKTKVLISGVAGDVVQVSVRGAASAAYSVLTQVTLNSAGASSAIISPSTNSSYVVGNTAGTSVARTLTVKAVQSLVVKVSGHTGIFTGHIAPSVVGRTVLVYFYPNGGHVATACSTKTTQGGQFKCQKTFTPGTYNTFAQTNADTFNAAGRSSLHTNAF